MLEDRDYMRQPSGGFRWSATLTLLVALVIAFVLQKTVLLNSPLGDHLALDPADIKRGYVWELLTFQFLHAGFFHLLFNGWTLYIFGREVERVLGKLQFLTLYFISGIIGGLFQVMVSLVWPHYFFGATVGASAGIFGVVAAFAMLFPDQMLTLLVFFVIPVNLRAKMLLIISLVIAALGLSFPQTWVAHLLGGNIAHGAHFGGILTGMAFIRFGGQLRQALWAPFESRRSKRELVSVRGPKWSYGKSQNPADLPEDEFISREVDPILDKISQHGIQSLTERERKILEAARNKMAKR